MLRGRADALLAARRTKPAAGQGSPSAGAPLRAAAVQPASHGAPQRALPGLPRTARARRAVLCHAQRTGGSSGHWQHDGMLQGEELSASRRDAADLQARRRRVERRMQRLEQELELAARDEKEGIVDELDVLKMQLDEICARMLPDTVADILAEWAMVWYIERGDAEYDMVADALGVVSSSSGRLHCAQDVALGWRWLEDPNGSVLRERPACLRRSAPMSFRALADAGLNVHTAHRMVAPRFLVSFAEVSNWEQAGAAVAAAKHALQQLQEDGWEIDNGTFCSDETQLLLVKRLTPLRTLQHESTERLLGSGAAQQPPQPRERTLARSVPQCRTGRDAAVGRRKRSARVRSKRTQAGGGDDAGGAQ